MAGQKPTKVIIASTHVENTIVVLAYFGDEY